MTTTKTKSIDSQMQELWASLEESKELLAKTKAIVIPEPFDDPIPALSPAPFPIWGIALAAAAAAAGLVAGVAITGLIF